MLNLMRGYKVGGFAQKICSIKLLFLYYTIEKDNTVNWFNNTSG